MVRKWVITYNLLITPLDFTWNIIMGVWKMIFLSKLVMCRFQPVIFQGAPGKIACQKGKDHLRTVNFSGGMFVSRRVRRWSVNTFHLPTNSWIVKIKRSFWRSWCQSWNWYTISNIYTNFGGHVCNLWVWVTISLTIPKRAQRMVML